MRSGELAAEEYARALLEQAARLEHLNAFRTLVPERVLEAARDADRARAAGRPSGLLHGLPLPVKDSVNTRELPTSNGARALERFEPREDAAVLRPLFARGAVLMGKTNIHELSRGWTSNNFGFGAVRNPYDAARIPGGSSGGSAVAVAARMAPLAIAEDTLGSIRIPATMCGVAGLRPTFGRYPGAGVMPLTSDKFDQVGPLARYVSDLILFDAAATGDVRPIEPLDLRNVRIGLAPGYFLTGLDPEVERVFSEGVQRIRASGAEIVGAELPLVMSEAPYVGALIIGYENRASISAFLAEHDAGVTFEDVLAQASPLFRAAYEGPPVAEDAYREALSRREQIKRAALEYFTTHRLHALAFPPALAPAPPLGDNLEFTIRGERVSIRTVMSRNTALGSLASLCSLVLPGGLTSEGLPVGIEFAAPSGADRELLALGLSLEQALGRIRPPAI